METLSDQKDLQVEAKVIDEISDLELGDIICIIAFEEAVSVCWIVYRNVVIL